MWRALSFTIRLSSVGDSPRASATRRSISCGGRCDSSVSISSRSDGISATVAGLNLSPIEKYRGLFPGVSSNCRNICGFPRNPCRIQGWLPCDSFLLFRNLSRALTRWMTIGFPDFSLSWQCVRKISSCVSGVAPLSPSSPVSPMARICGSERMVSIICGQSCVRLSVSHGCTPTEQYPGCLSLLQYSFSDSERMAVKGASGLWVWTS